MHHLLVDFDGKIPNLALMKVSSWAKTKGDTAELVKVRWKKGDPLIPMRFYEAKADECWLSCIFTWHREKAEKLIHPTATMHRGGTGFDSGQPYGQRIELPLEIENQKADYTLYGDDRAVGFCQRGCNRKCQFCDVWRKEGRISQNEYHRIAE